MESYEGPDRFSAAAVSAGTLTFPIHTYDHAVGRSITGGYVYRGESEGLQGQYFFADFSEKGGFDEAMNDGMLVPVQHQQVDPISSQ